MNRKNNGIWLLLIHVVPLCYKPKLICQHISIRCYTSYTASQVTEKKRQKGKWPRTFYMKLSIGYLALENTVAWIIKCLHHPQFRTRGKSADACIIMCGFSTPLFHMSPWPLKPSFDGVFVVTAHHSRVYSEYILCTVTLHNTCKKINKTSKRQLGHDSIFQRLWLYASTPQNFYIHVKDLQHNLHKN